MGDVVKTVNDIGFATFNSIAATADWYVSSFKDNPMTAGTWRRRDGRRWLMVS